MAVNLHRTLSPTDFEHKLSKHMEKGGVFRDLFGAILTPEKTGVDFLYQYIGRRYPGVIVRRLLTAWLQDPRFPTSVRGHGFYRSLDSR
jgi:hypothetical protein